MNNKKGFSLIELLVVVAIIGILSVILVPNVQEQLRRAKVAKTKALIGSLEVTIETYKNDFGKYPPSYDPQTLYLSLVEYAKTSYEPDSDEYRYVEKGDSLWQDPNRPNDILESILQMAGVPSNALKAQLDENVIVDAWNIPIYYISHEEYNPSGRTDFRRASSNRTAGFDDNKPCAYEIRDGKRYRPFSSKSFQLISFGPDGTTLTPTRQNGGIGCMIDTDKKDNDEDGYFDNEDRVRPGDRNSNDPEVVAEDDVT
ncbi:MAG: prepilin-type N-terminal cleavage/methylation domain-containing protein, partial [Candidatus Omnitrophica bacterium]|nr:prepilin-type N-terminal cleavage/methylation domain-containing protein [Candidatus Omnitrophota bacterium]